MARPEHLVFFSKFIETDLGIVFSEFNDFQLERRLEEISKKRGLKSVAELYAHARLNFDSELKKLVRDAATNNETYFFRDPKAFEALKSTLLPLIFERAREEKRRPRIWSMACSYGQEPYSIAFLCKELVSAKSSRWLDPEIVATDIATHALAKGSSATYTQSEIDRGLPSNYLNRFFDKVGVEYQVNKEIRSLIRFQSLNLLSDSFMLYGKFDLILCRNVLIYQSVENKKAVVHKIKAALNPAGYLVLGAGETLIGISEELKGLKLSDTIVFVNDLSQHASLLAG